MAPLADEIEALMPLGLEGLREVWRNRYGAPPKLRSAALLRHCLAWRLQAEALGGLDRDTRRKLKRRQRVQAEGLELGIQRVQAEGLELGIDPDNAAARMARADSPGHGRRRGVSP